MHITVLERFKVISITVMPSNDLRVLENVQRMNE